jgi:hypothetical protein
VDEISQREKREVLKVDTYFNRAQAEADMAVGGRWKKQSETTVTGTPTYPQQPSSSPWSRGLDEVSGAEPSFGVDIEYVGALGGESPAPVSTPETVETASATDRGESSPTALTELSPRFLRRRV